MSTTTQPHLPDGTSRLPRWEHFPHGADAGVRGVGATQAEAFAQAAVALVALVVDVDSVSPTTSIEAECHEADVELLLVDWLNTVVREMAVRRFIFSSFELTILGPDLRATMWGEPIVPSRHQPRVEVKGATFTELRVSHSGDVWTAQCVVDV